MTLTKSFTEGRHAGEYRLSLAAGHRSTDAITLAAGAALSACLVLGMVTVGAATAAAVAGNTGNGTIGAVTLSAGAKPGTYRVTFVEAAENAGAFLVEDPDGVTVGSGDVGAAFSGGGVAFTIADGATDFAAGDGFTISIALGSGRYAPLAPAATDGTQIAAGILYAPVDDSAGLRAGVADVRDCEVNGAKLVWPPGITDNQKSVAVAQLAARGIIVR